MQNSESTIIWFDHTILPIRVSSEGEICSKQTGKTRKAAVDTGYAKLKILGKDYYVHRLVAE